jgi:hypothetical protein
MSTTQNRPRETLPESVLFAVLPGPSRKRHQVWYCYHLTFRAEQIDEPGCLLLWEVFGGREVYQVAVERMESGGLHWYCTCADAVYRGGERHCCKHIRGLQQQGRNPELTGLAPPIEGTHA